jgi:hypothetical protein
MTQNEHDELLDRCMRISLLLGQSMGLNLRLAGLLNSYGELPDEIKQLQKELYENIDKLFYGVDDNEGNER